LRSRGRPCRGVRHDRSKQRSRGRRLSAVGVEFPTHRRDRRAGDAADAQVEHHTKGRDMNAFWADDFCHSSAQRVRVSGYAEAAKPAGDALFLHSHCGWAAYQVERRYCADAALVYCGLLLDRRGMTRGIVDARNDRERDITEFCSKGPAGWRKGSRDERRTS